MHQQIFLPMIPSLILCRLQRQQIDLYVQELTREESLLMIHSQIDAWHLHQQIPLPMIPSLILCRLQRRQIDLYAQELGREEPLQMIHLQIDLYIPELRSEKSLMI